MQQPGLPEHPGVVGARLDVPDALADGHGHEAAQDHRPGAESLGGNPAQGSDAGRPDPIRAGQGHFLLVERGHRVPVPADAGQLVYWSRTPYGLVAGLMAEGQVGGYSDQYGPAYIELFRPDGRLVQIAYARMGGFATDPWDGMSHGCRPASRRASRTRSMSSTWRPCMR